MMHRTLVALVCLALLVANSTVFAHEGREVGDYEITVGWRNEPAYVGLPNGPEVHIGVEGAEEGTDPLRTVDVSLQVEIIFGPASKIVRLQRDFTNPGSFIADVIPTRPGDYTFRVFGTIGDLEIDETFSASEGAFDTIEPATDITFPDEMPSMLELMNRIVALEARLSELGE